MSHLEHSSTEALELLNEIERDETETCLELVLFTVQWIDDHDYLACF